MGRRQIICLGLIGLFCVVFPATAAIARSTTVAIADPEAVEGGFRLHGSHGYLISVSAYSAGADRGGTIEFVVTGRGTRATYRAPASVTADTISADLGRLGRVEVLRIPSGHQETVHPRCFGESVTYERASYEGLIEFDGEHGYTRARVNRVAQIPAFLVFLAGSSCAGGSGEAIDSQEPGARLRGISFSHGRILSFQVNKNSPKGRMRFTASLRERRGQIWIHRELSGVEPPGAFSFDPHLQTATMSPRAPFRVRLHSAAAKPRSHPSGRGTSDWTSRGTRPCRSRAPECMWVWFTLVSA